MHLVGFTIEIYYDARPYELQIMSHILFLFYLTTEAQSASKMCAFAKGDDRISEICANSGNIVLANTLNISASSQV